MKHSHLGVSSQQGKPYDFKGECAFCLFKYNKELSHALAPAIYCSTECEVEDKYLSDAYLDHDNSPFQKA